MGEMAEMLLDGTLCEGCGVSLDGKCPGYPRYCSKTCAEDRGADYDDDHPFDEIDRDMEVIKQALREYKKIAHTYKCRQGKCEKTSKGIKHTEDCHANKHRKLAKKAWSNFQENFL
jgi:hypothetical protein